MVAPMMPIVHRDAGMGLNFNRGFGQRSGPVGSTGALEHLQLGGQYGLGMQRAREAEKQRGFDRGNLNLQLGAQREQAAQQAELQRQGYANQHAMAQMQAEASKYPHQLRQGRWNQIFPHVSGLLGQLGQGGGFGAGYAGQGQVGQQPQIDANPIYDQQMIQEQVNATRSTNDAALASRQAAQARSLAGKGFGSRSPLAMAMDQAAFGQNLAGNTAAEQQLRFNLAQANAKHMLDAQQAREQQFARRQTEDIDRNKVQSGLVQGLIGNILGAI